MVTLVILDWYPCQQDGSSSVSPNQPGPEPTSSFIPLLCLLRSTQQHLRNADSHLHASSPSHKPTATLSPLASSVTGSPQELNYYYNSAPAMQAVDT
jgi:hypothetical protein